MSMFEAKGDGFRGERMIVLPTEAFQDYVEHPQVRRMYLTDVGFFPRARDHYRERKEGIEEYMRKCNVDDINDIIGKVEMN